MTVNELVEMLSEAISENVEFGDKMIAMIVEESGDTVCLGWFYELCDSIHLCSEESEELD